MMGMGFSAMAGPFAVPAEGPVAFRRDKIPLDADAMAGLSKQLQTLAASLAPETPADHRGAAQMLALALALDPANAKARELISDYQSQNHQAGDDLDRLEKSRARIWQYIAWLETPDAGSDGQALAACLKDVIIISDPKNPKSAAIREAGEKGAWAGWVPAVSAYEEKDLAANGSPSEPQPGSADPAPTESPTPAGQLEKAQVYTLLWQSTGKGETAVWTLAPAPLQMTASLSETEGGGEEGSQAKAIPFSLTVGNGEEGSTVGRMAQTIRALLNSQHKKLPAGLKVTINNKELEKSLESKRRQSISAAAAVLANAAVSGQEPDAVILGSVDETGAYKLPTAFWDQLMALGKGGGRRLILPAEAAIYLPSILALEKPGFFMDYEVLLATDFNQLVALSTKTPEGPLASASTEFRKIRERQGAQDVRLYIANTFVKQRMMVILQEVPTHFSAKMLLIQAAGNRPTLIARQVLATELRRALEPMRWILDVQDSNRDDSNFAKLGETYESCRTKVDAMERYAEKNDKILVDHAREVVIAIRNLDRATRTRGESYVITHAVQTAHSDLKRLAKEFSDEIAADAGDGLILPAH
jgi:hypothetical protein